MAHPFGDPLLIANPRFGRGHRDVLSRVVAALRGRGVAPEIATTEGPGHATVLAREAVERDGRGYLVAVGGDGTLHEVVNGVVDADTGELRGADPVVGAVGAGTGCDLLRTFGLNRTPEILAEHLSSDATMRIDLGRVRVTGPGGIARNRVFANVAEVGYGAEVVALANRLPQVLGKARYGIGIVGTVTRFRLVDATVTVASGQVTQPLSNVIVAKGQFFGGGMMVAPRALPSNGKFNVQAWGGQPVDVIRGARQLKTGAHLRRDDVREWQSATVEVSAARPLVVEADGEVLGRSPASFDVLASVLRFKL